MIIALAWWLSWQNNQAEHLSSCDLDRSYEYSQSASAGSAKLFKLHRGFVYLYTCCCWFLPDQAPRQQHYTLLIQHQFHRWAFILKEQCVVFGEEALQQTKWTNSCPPWKQFVLLPAKFCKYQNSGVWISSPKTTQWPQPTYVSTKITEIQLSCRNKRLNEFWFIYLNTFRYIFTSY